MEPSRPLFSGDPEADLLSLVRSVSERLGEPVRLLTVALVVDELMDRLRGDGQQQRDALFRHCAIIASWADDQGLL